MSFSSPIWIRRAVLGALVGAAACSGDSPSSPNNGGTTGNTLTLNGTTLKVAVAATNAARAKGLMGVTTMAADSAMLFVFSDDRQRGFWMKDTPIPLSIAFLDANKKIVFMADMPPNTTTVYGAFNAPQMRYALEVNQGWFAAHGVTVGMTASFTVAATDFVQSMPNPGANASHRTEARVLYDRDALYIGVRMFDAHPDSIAQQIARRDSDDIYSDWIRIAVDSYLDRRTAFVFAVSPRGLQRDEFRYNDLGNEVTLVKRFEADEGE